MNIRSSRSFALLAVALVACTTATPSPSPGSAGPSTAPPVSASATATQPAGAPTLSSGPVAAAAAPAGGIEAHALGVLTGDWAFVVATTRTPGTGPPPTPIVDELWAVPLGGGEPRLAVRYASGSAGANSQNNVIGRQLSADGRRVVLSVATPRPLGGARFSMEIVEIETGRVTMLGRDDADSDLSPSWSPDPARIAYRRVPDAPSGGAFDDGVWWMGADGAGVRRAVPGAQGQAAIVHDWTPDARGIAFSYVFEEATFMVVDPFTGARTRLGGFVTDLRAHSWRRSAPNFAGAFMPTPKSTPPYIEVAEVGADGLRGEEQVVVKETDGNVFLGGVRWHPVRNELLYLRGTQGGRELWTLELGGSPVQIPTTGRPLQAEWSPTGNDVVYLNGDAQAPFVATELRTVRRDGTSDRPIFAPRERMVLTDVAVRRYQ